MQLTNNISHIPAVSIIVPVYNVENYLPRCIDSIIRQVFSDFECILVDDGSIDSSLSICEKYAQIDYRFRVIAQTNRGAAAARNEGLKYVKGPFVVFVDSDDELEVDYLSQLMKPAKSVDLVISGIKNYDIKGCITHQKRYDYCTYESLDIKSVCELIDKKAIDGPCSKRFKSELIQKKHLQFPTKLKLSEDTCFVASYLCACANATLIEGAAYKYYKYNHETLTTFSHKYLEEIQIGERFLTDILRTRYPEIIKSHSLLKRNFGNYYYAIFTELSSKDSFIKKYRFLKNVFSKSEYNNFIPEMNTLAQNDSKIIRFALRNKLAFLLLTVIALSNAKKHLNKSLRINKFNN